MEEKRLWAWPRNEETKEEGGNHKREDGETLGALPVSGFSRGFPLRIGASPSGMMLSRKPSRMPLDIPLIPRFS